ncbi:MAG: glycosyltransferase [Candidatus Micrarchaeota archaeon]|nr:glycosyltransferase [Candidatus Micrarchaeota archaeon]MDE1823734.1 glycosyltransferase [Candidatus Micrarchaeota archaeon]MDE1849208.1 glycosyltransferase [Candidatus Micrarchaeota archaeon]
MKVIIAQPYINLRGGVDRVILRIAEHYKAKILTLEYDSRNSFDEFSKLDIEVVGKKVPLSGMLPYRASQGFRYGYSFYNMKLDEDYDVINAHISPSEWIRHRNERVLWYCHTPPREVYDLYDTRMKGRGAREKLVYAAMAKAYRLIANGVTKDIEEIATNSETTKERIRKYYSRSATVVNPGIDARGYANGGDGRFFLYPSRILVNKRQEYVIDAFRRFAKASKGNYELVIAGSLSNDPEHQLYYEKIREMARGQRIRIIKNASEEKLRNLYSTCSAVLFAAMNEDFGFIPLEAMASGKPVISVNEGGPRETIIDNKTGFLVGSPKEMADRMLFVTEHKDIAERMGREGRRRAENEYSWNRFFEKLDPLMKRVAKGR